MAADNWARCPQCAINYRKKIEERWKILHDNYGKIRPEQFYKEFEEMESTPKNLKETTLREDWDMGITDDGMFYASYKASCSVCGFKFSFEKQDTEGVTLRR